MTKRGKLKYNLFAALMTVDRLDFHLDLRHDLGHGLGHLGHLGKNLGHSSKYDFGHDLNMHMNE